MAAIGRYTQQQWGKQQRKRYLQALDKQFHALAKTPGKGHKRDDIAAGLRSFPQGEHIIFYLRRSKDIVIVDILHRRMDPLHHIRP